MSGTQLSAIKLALLEAVKNHPNQSNAFYAEKVSRSEFTVKDQLSELRKLGLVEFEIKGQGFQRTGVWVTGDPAVLSAASEEEEAKPENIVKKVESDRQLARAQAQAREAERKYAAVLRELEMSEQRFDALITIKAPVEVHRIEPVLGHKSNEAIPIISLSDWHFEERVDPATINGLNEYNLEVAESRWTKCVQNSLKLVHKERSYSDIKQAVLWLGGDFITGYIHEELEESNYLSPTEATRFAKRMIITAIKFYLEHGKFEKLIIPCSYGNHGRTNKKPRVSTGYKNSYEWMMYHDVADYFSGDKRVQFIIPNGIFAYVDVLGYMCRFWHGDTVSYQGGIGGLTIPLIKAIQRYNQQQHADYNFMGHYHQLWQATKDCIVNGSGIGFNAYAQRIGASPEPPRQAFSLIDGKRGLTTKMEIYC